MSMPQQMEVPGLMEKIPMHVLLAAALGSSIRGIAALRLATTTIATTATTSSVFELCVRPPRLGNTLPFSTFALYQPLAQRGEAI